MWRTSCVLGKAMLWVGFGIGFIVCSFSFFVLPLSLSLMIGCIHVFSSECCWGKRYSLQWLCSKGEKNCHGRKLFKKP